MLLSVKDLRVEVAGKEILHGVSLDIERGQTHVLLGPNGGGKTTLLMWIMGMPKYRITAGSISFDGRDVTVAPVDERARLGIALSFQRPPQIRGVKAAGLLTQIGGDDLVLDELAERLNIKYLLERDINVGFSGGEVKRTELAQLMAMDPELAMFDEPESGVDLDNIVLVGQAMAELLGKARAKGNEKSGLIVTHTGHILDFVNGDKGHVLIDGRLVCSGNPRDLFAEIKTAGYDKCAACFTGRGC